MDKHIKRDVRQGKSSASTAIFADIVFCGDRSRSMSSMGDAPYKGLIEFIKDQKETLKKQNLKGSLTVCSFDNEMEEVYFKDIQKEKITDGDDYVDIFKPRGTTRLLDTLVIQLYNQHKRVEEYKANLPRKLKCLDPEIYRIFAVITDGYDNESDSTVLDLNRAVRRAISEGTTCLFLGANQDAIQSASRYGFSSSLSMNIGSTPDFAYNALKSCSQAVNRSISGSSACFTPLERTSSAPTYPSNITPSPIRYSSKVVARPGEIQTNYKLNMSNFPPPCLPKRELTFNYDNYVDDNYVNDDEKENDKCEETQVLGVNYII